MKKLQFDVKDVKLNFKNMKTNIVINAKEIFGKKILKNVKGAINSLYKMKRYIHLDFIVTIIVIIVKWKLKKKMLKDVKGVILNLE